MHRWTIATICLLILTLSLDAANAETVTRQIGYRVRTIYIDPWYGGKDKGPRISGKVFGKDLTLALSKKLQSRFESMGLSSYLSRTGDQFVPLRKECR